MSLSLSDADYNESDIAHANYPMVRFFEMQVSPADEPAKNIGGDLV